MVKCNFPKKNLSSLSPQPSLTSAPLFLRPPWPKAPNLQTHEATTTTKNPETHGATKNSKKNQKPKKKNRTDCNRYLERKKARPAAAWIQTGALFVAVVGKERESSERETELEVRVTVREKEGLGLRSG